MSEHNLTEEEFSVLLEWYMVSDPWPLTLDADGQIRNLLTEEAQSWGYEDWVEAYHEIDQ